MSRFFFSALTITRSIIWSKVYVAPVKWSEPTPPALGNTVYIGNKER